MTLSRRHLLVAGGGLAAARLVGTGRPRDADQPVLLLHSDALRPDGWAPGHAVSLQTSSDLIATRALLARARGDRLVAVVNDSDALVIEHLLARHGARAVQRASAASARPIVLTAIL